MSPSERKKTKIVVKNPTQERSRQTVSTILDACARLLVTEGFYSITTDKIAKEAGVSIGSLYQFFGNKESVVQALVKNITEEDKRFYTEQLGQIGNLPMLQQIEVMTEAAIATVKRNAELRAKISTVRYYVSEHSEIAESQEFYKQQLQNILPVVPGRNNAKISSLIVHTFTGLINTLAIAHPQALEDPEFTKEITLMLTSYVSQHQTQ